MFEVVFYPRKKSLVIKESKGGFKNLKACENFLFEHLEYCKRDFLGYYRKCMPYSSVEIYEKKKGYQRLIRNIVFTDKSDIIEVVEIWKFLRRFCKDCKI